MKKLLQQEENNRPKKQFLRFAKYGVVLIFAVLILEIWVMNRLSTYGDKIDDLKINQKKLALENQVLENRIAQELSLVNIEGKASVLGLQTVKNVEYLKTSDLASAY